MYLDILGTAESFVGADRVQLKIAKLKNTESSFNWFLFSQRKFDFETFGLLTKQYFFETFEF